MKNSALYKFLLQTVNRAIGRITNRSDAGPGGQELLMNAPAPFIPALPINATALPAELATYFHETVTLPAVWLYRVQQVAVSWHMVVFRNLRIFLPALAHPREEKHYEGTYLLQQWTGLRVTPPTDGLPLALIHNQWTGSNFYHWIVDSLPRLLLLRATHPGCRLLMPAPVPAFVRDSAALLGFTDLLLLEPGTTLVRANLLVPGHVSPPGYQHPALLQEVRKQLIGAIYHNKALPVPHRRVYASRRSQRVRRLLNESDLAELLAHYGYETVEFEDLSLVEQVKLMAETRSFVTVHGAGLTNMLFLPPGTQVAELFNKDKILRLCNQDFENLIYSRMASALGLPYFCLPCANVDDDPPSNAADLRVDVVAFGRLLALMAAGDAPQEQLPVKLDS